MKKFLFYLTMLITLASCKPTLSGYDFHKVLAEDKALIESKVNGDSVKINFCESQGVFSEPFKKESKTFEVVSIQNVFQVNDTLVYIVKHLEKEYDAEPVVEVYSDIWVGDLYSPIDVTINLEKAIKLIKESDVEAPETPFFVLRRPITPPPFPENKYYIFGSTKTKPIKVDSKTGEVSYL